MPARLESGSVLKKKKVLIFGGGNRSGLARKNRDNDRRWRGRQRSTGLLPTGRQPPIKTMSGVVARPRFVRALGAQRRANVMRVAARREGAASSSSSSVVDVERAGVNFGTTSRLTAGLGTALASAAILAAVAACGPALADTGLETGLEEVFPKFEVTFLGQKFNHRNLVELLVLGQTIGFVGASVTGNALRKQKREVEALNEKLTRVSKELRKQTERVPDRSTLSSSYSLNKTL